MNHKCQLWLRSKMLMIDPFLLFVMDSHTRPPPLFFFFCWFLLACLGAGDPIHQRNGPAVGIMCEPNEMRSLYTYGHRVFLSVSIKRRIRNERRPRAAPHFVGAAFSTVPSQHLAEMNQSGYGLQ